MLNDLARQIYINACEKGWHDEPVAFGDAVTNIHGELSEAWEEYRNKKELKEDFMKQELHNKYIKSDNQHIIYNDGSMISWWKADDACIEIHQSDLETDNHVFVEIEDLINVIRTLGIVID